jgi:mercuric reductase
MAGARGSADTARAATVASRDDHPAPADREDEAMADRIEWTFDIDGMTCTHCAATIDETLRRIAGVLDSTTSYPDRRARVVAAASVDGRALATAIAQHGYTVRAQTARPLSTDRAQPDEVPDLAILGGGSAAFAAAIKAAELGARVTLVEAGPVGGTCVNVGCVPSKTLLRAAEILHRARHHGFAGVRMSVEPPDLEALVRQKDELVGSLRQSKYLDVLAAYPSVRLVHGRARFNADGMLEVDGQPLAARRIVIATGSHPWAPPIPGLDTVAFLTSTEALALTRPPRSLIVIGGSAVGLELAQLFARLGTEVTVLEALPRLVPAEDAEIGEALAQYLRAEGLSVHPGVTVRRVSGRPGAVRIEVEADGATHQFDAEQVLVATGRRPNTRELGLDRAGIRLGAKGEIVVDEYLRTTRPGVYAAGDVTGDPMFVYVAAYAGSLAAENALLGDTRQADLSVVPRVTFTDPAVASVGLTEAQARARGDDVMVTRLPLGHVPRALVSHDTRGFIKLVADRATNRFLGAHILAPDAGEIIMPVAMAMRFNIRVDEFAALLFPYLTATEGLKLAAQSFTKDVARLSCCAS